MLQTKMFKYLLIIILGFSCSISSNRTTGNDQGFSGFPEQNPTLISTNATLSVNESIYKSRLSYQSTTFPPNIYPPPPFILGPYPWMMYHNRWCIQDIFGFLWCLHGLYRQNS
ncbi:unnamed protein product [Heterobilharzia americana]|nr:unnamed protein product [Heterobilharzia americana]CAH8446343.1 unnamed protein product [Heterobilharzia americana]